MVGRNIEHFIADHTDIAAVKDADYRYDRKTKVEIYSETFWTHLVELNKIILKMGGVFEGSNFYWQGTEIQERLEPAESLGAARRNIWRVVRFKQSMFEIGVNAGHTALLALMANPSLTYVGVDICLNPYARECAAYLRSAFPDRFKFYEGDSREIVPALVNSPLRGTFDLLHVDGGHYEGMCRADMHNTFMLAGAKRAHLILDDINAEWIFDVYCEFLVNGLLQTEELFGDWEEVNRNVLARILRPQ